MLTSSYITQPPLGDYLKKKLQKGIHLLGHGPLSKSRRNSANSPELARLRPKLTPASTETRQRTLFTRNGTTL